MRPALVVLTKFRSNVKSQYIVVSGSSDLRPYTSLICPSVRQHWARPHKPRQVGVQLARPEL